MPIRILTLSVLMLVACAEDEPSNGTPDGDTQRSGDPAPGDSCGGDCGTSCFISECGCLGACPAACGDLGECSSCSPHQMPAAIQTYFDAQAMPIVEVAGTFPHCGQAMCSVIDDFNGDGTDDFAGVFHYTGGDRGGDWELELVIIYSDGPDFTHIAYPYFGRITDGIIQTHLVPEPAGFVQGESLAVTLQYPGIRSFRLGVRAKGGCYSEATVHYWDVDQFARATLSPIP